MPPKSKIQEAFIIRSDPGRTRTCNPQSRNLIFYPIELRSHEQVINMVQMYNSTFTVTNLVLRKFTCSSQTQNFFTQEIASIVRLGTCVPAGPSKKIKGFLLWMRLKAGNWFLIVSFIDDAKLNQVNYRYTVLFLLLCRNSDILDILVNKN